MARWLAMSDVSAASREVGALLRARRKQQRVTLAELSRTSGYSAPQISKLETGQRALRPQVVTDLAQALGVAPDKVQRWVQAIAPDKRRLLDGVQAELVDALGDPATRGEVYDTIVTSRKLGEVVYYWEGSRTAAVKLVRALGKHRFVVLRRRYGQRFTQWVGTPRDVSNDLLGAGGAGEVITFRVDRPVVAGDCVYEAVAFDKGLDRYVRVTKGVAIEAVLELLQLECGPVAHPTELRLVGRCPIGAIRGGPGDGDGHEFVVYPRKQNLLDAHGSPRKSPEKHDRWECAVCALAGDQVDLLAAVRRIDYRSATLALKQEFQIEDDECVSYEGLPVPASVLTRVFAANNGHVSRLAIAEMEGLAATVPAIPVELRVVMEDHDEELSRRRACARALIAMKAEPGPVLRFIAVHEFAALAAWECAFGEAAAAVQDAEAVVAELLGVRKEQPPARILPDRHAPTLGGLKLVARLPNCAKALVERVLAITQQSGDPSTKRAGLNALRALSKCGAAGPWEETLSFLEMLSKRWEPEGPAAQRSSDVGPVALRAADQIRKVLSGSVG